jgi:folate-dependent phosphoribosylglycinamide formyltransferase PurN
VLADDDEASLHERIKAVERRLYPDTIRAVLADPSLLTGTR